MFLERIVGSGPLCEVDVQSVEASTETGRRPVHTVDLLCDSTSPRVNNLGTCCRRGLQEILSSDDLLSRKFRVLFASVTKVF